MKSVQFSHDHHHWVGDAKLLKTLLTNDVLIMLLLLLLLLLLPCAHLRVSGLGRMRGRGGG